MPIGQIVQNSIPAIFNYCEDQDPEEFTRLQNRDYSRETFGINYPFCMAIGEAEHRRYWVQEYVVCGVSVRVTNHWYDHHWDAFEHYLRQRNIEVPIRPNGHTADETTAAETMSASVVTPDYLDLRLAEIRADMQTQKAEILKWMFAALLGQTAVIAALIRFV